MPRRQSFSSSHSQIDLHPISRHLVLALLTVAGLIAGAQAQQFSVIHTFKGSPDGSTPYSGVIEDGDGNLYGTTNLGGQYNWGTVYKVEPDGKETVLHSFAGGEHGGHDGLYPWSGLVMDGSSNLYGTTYEGGAGECYLGCGTVYKLSPSGRVTILHSFQNSPDGEWPFYGTLLRDQSGNLYGTTYYGGTQGTAFKVDAAGHETVLYSFSTERGSYPYSGLVMDASGNLYGTTLLGGSNVSGGVVYKLDKKGHQSVLYNFQGGLYNHSKDGDVPEDALLMDGAGNLYGTTVFGGTDVNFGTVFKITSKGKEKVLYSFTGAGDGSNPIAGVVRDAAGNLYGTTSAGGADGQGVVFRLDTAGKLTVLHAFTGGTDGAVPLGGSLLLDSRTKTLYGTSSAGGSGFGVIFKIKL